MEILLQIQLKCENCIEWNIFLYDLIIKCYGIREKMTYVAAHKLRSGPSSDHKLFNSHYGTPCTTTTVAKVGNCWKPLTN